MKSLLRDHRDVAMLMVIAFMALSIPMITGALSLSGTLSSDSTVKTEILKRQYSALGGDQWGNYVIEEGLPPGEYPIDLNYDPINAVVGDLPSLLYPPPPADDSRRLFSAVTPETASPADFNPSGPFPQVFTFAVTITNRNDDPEGLTKIDAMLPRVGIR